MDDQSSQPPPEDSPLTVDDTKVDNLLDQAQALVDDIASTVDGSAGHPDPDKPPDNAPPAGEEPDASTSVEAVEQQLAELDELVADVAKSDVESEAVEQTASSSDSEADSAPSEEPADTPPESDAQPASSTSTDEPDESETVPDSDVEANQAKHPLLNEEDDLAFDGEFGAESDLDMSDGADSFESDSSDESPQTDGEKSKTPLPPRSVKQRAIDTGKVALRKLLSAVMIVPRTIGAVLVTLDRPFANISPSVKKVLGYIAIVTVLMGAISLILPVLFSGNPYDKLPP